MDDAAQRALEAANHLLPAWCRWGPVLFTWVCVPGIAWVTARLALASALRLSKNDPGAHWTERARRADTLRGAVSAAFFASAVGGLVIAREFANPLSATGSFRTGLVAAGLAFVACTPAWHAGERMALPGPLPYRGWAKSVLTSSLVNGAGLAIVLAASVAPARIDDAFWAWAAGSAVFIAYSPGVGMAVAEIVGVMRPGSERSRRIVAEAARRVNVPVPRVFELSTFRAGAYAVPVRRYVLFTDGALASMDDVLLTAVAVHELGHLSESRAMTRLRMLAVVAVLPLVAVRPIAGSFGVLAAIAMCGASLFAILSSGEIFRRLEERADRIGVESSSSDYARALERIYELNLIPAATRKRYGRTHPDLYERLVAAGSKPEYPRPVAPPRLQALGLPVFAATLLLVFSHRAVQAVLSSSDATENIRYAALAFGGGAGEAEALSRLLADRDLLDEATTLNAAAAALSAERP